MSGPLVSVITPCYRQANYLPGAVECVQNQSYGNIEHVVVNDGSDDDTAEVAASYGDSIHYVWKPNGGLSSARNAGIQVASGKYLLFLDSDDLMDPDAVAWHVEAMQDQDNRMTMVGLCYFTDDPLTSRELEYLPTANLCSLLPDSFLCDPTLAGQPSSLPDDAQSLLPYLFYTCFGPPHCHMCSRSMVTALGGFEEHFQSVGCEDWDLWMRLALQGAEVATIARVGAFYRRYEGSMSTNVGKMLQCRTEVLLRASQDILGKPDLLRRLGVDLLQAMIRVRRRYLAQGLKSPLVDQLTQAIRALERAGVPRQGSLTRRLLGRVLGSSTDKLALTYYRYFRRDVYSYYQGSYE